MTRIDRLRTSLPFAAALALAGFLAGCFGGNPSKANIELRKQNEQLRSDLSTAQSQRDATAATVRSLQSGATTVPTLPQDQLDELITAHDIRIGRLTAIKPAETALNASTSQPAVNGLTILEVHVAPLDETGDSIKAAGAFVVEAFDLSKPGENRVGHWEFSAAGSRSLWLSGLMVYEFALPCPLEAKPASDKITVRVAFTDALTRRTFTQQVQISTK